MQTFGGETSKEVSLIVKPIDLNLNYTKENQTSNKEHHNEAVVSSKNSSKYAEPSVETHSENHQQEQQELEQGQQFQQTQQIPETIIHQSQYVDIFGNPINREHITETNANLELNFVEYNNQIETTLQNNEPANSQLRFDLSPSTFISTDLVDSSLPSAESNSNSNNFGQQVHHLNSSYFDEIMRNFSMSDFNSNNGNPETLKEIEKNNYNSNEFIDISVDHHQQQQQLQTFVNNLEKESEPANIEIVNSGGKENSPMKLSNNLVAEPANAKQETNMPLKYIDEAATLAQSPVKSTTTISAIASPKVQASPISSTKLSNINTINIVKSPVSIVKTTQIIKQGSSLANLIQSKSTATVKSESSSPVTASKISSLKFTNEKLVPSLIKPASSSSQQQLDQQKATAANFSNINKSFVIYKVEADDVKKDNAANLLKHLNQEEVAQSSCGAIVQNENKKLKLNSFPITKVKTNTDSIATTATINNEKPKNSIDDNTSQMTLTNEISENEEKTKSSILSIDNSEIREVILSKNNLIYTIDSLIENSSFKSSEEKRKESTSTTKTTQQSFEVFLRRNLRYYPIIITNNSNNNNNNNNQQESLIKSQSYAAKSIHEFYSWPYAKRKAIEWIRALYLKRDCIASMCKCLNVSNENYIRSQLWSTKNVVLWLRSHGYTPLEYKHMKLVNSQTISLNEAKLNYVYSLTSISDILPENSYDSESLNYKSKANRMMECDNEEENELICVDVDSSEDTQPTTAEMSKRRKKKESVSLIDELNEINENQIEMSEEDLHVREQLDTLGIKTNLVSLVPSEEKPNESNLYACNLVEKFLAALCKRFADDLIRQSCSDVYLTQEQQEACTKKQANDRKSATSLLTRQASSEQLTMSCSSSNALDLNANPCQKFPMELNVRDIYNTIVKHEKFDFLTNKYMARPAKQEKQDDQSDANDSDSKDSFSTRRLDSNSNLSLKRKSSDISILK